MPSFWRLGRQNNHIFFILSLKGSEAEGLLSEEAWGLFGLCLSLGYQVMAVALDEKTRSPASMPEKHGAA